MKRIFLLGLLLLLAASAVFAQNFPFTSRNLPPGTVVISQPAFGPQQIFIFGNRSLQIVTPGINPAVTGGYLFQGPPGVWGRNAMGFPTMGGAGFYPPQTTGSFSLYGGPVVTIPLNRSNNRLVLSGPGFSPFPPGSSFRFNFGGKGAVWAYGGH